MRRCVEVLKILASKLMLLNPIIHGTTMSGECKKALVVGQARLLN